MTVAVCPSGTPNRLVSRGLDRVDRTVDSSRAELSDDVWEVTRVFDIGAPILAIGGISASGRPDARGGDHLTVDDIRACLAYAKEVIQSERVYAVKP